MPFKLIQTAGILWTLAFGVFVIWLYAVAPRDLTQATTSASLAVGTYQIDRARFDQGLELFRREQYPAARAEWLRADPARRDARTQFYVAYAFYREGWGRIYNDDALFREALEAVNRALELSPQQTLKIEDENLKIKTAVELKAEIEQGLALSLGDLNPLKMTRERK